MTWSLRDWWDRWWYEEDDAGDSADTAGDSGGAEGAAEFAVPDQSAEPEPVLVGAAVDMRKDALTADPPAPTSATKDTGPTDPTGLRRTLTPYVERRLLPTKEQAKAASKWWARAIGKILAYVALHPWVLFSELRPIGAGLVYLAAGWTAWVNAREQAGHVKEAIGDYRAKAGHHNETRKEGRRRLTVLLVIAFALGIGYLAFTGRTQWITGIALVIIAILDAVGRRVRKPKRSVIAMLPKSEVGPGATPATVAAIVEETLIEHGHTPTIAEHSVIPHGVRFKVHSRLEITDEDAAAVERALQGYPGSVAFLQQRDNAATSEMRWMWEDPLDRLVLPPRYAPRSQTVTRAPFMGIGWTGADLRLEFLRTNLFLVGSTGSGKTSVGIAMADFLTATDDARISIIDLTGGPFTTMWGDLPYRVATTEREAEDLLREDMERIRRRTKQIAGRSRPVPGGKPGSENWNPRIDGGPQHTIFIDEVPTFVSTGSTLRELWAEHQRTGRKGACNSVGMATSSDGDTIKLTALRKYPAMFIMLACSREDVIGLLGGGMLKQGWRPDKLTTAQGDSPNDAGKGYVNGGAYQSPTPYRFPRIDVEDVWTRVLEREPHGAPAFEGQTEKRQRDAVDAIEVPPVLAAIEAVFAEVGWPERIPSSELLVAVNTRGLGIDNTTALARRVNKWLVPRETRWYLNDGSRVKGYWADDVRAAIAGLGEG